MDLCYFRHASLPLLKSIGPTVSVLTSSSSPPPSPASVSSPSRAAPASPSMSSRGASASPSVSSRGVPASLRSSCTSLSSLGAAVLPSSPRTLDGALPLSPRMRGRPTTLPDLKVNKVRPDRIIVRCHEPMIAFAFMRTLERNACKRVITCYNKHKI